jgi:hypothetical protein
VERYHRVLLRSAGLYALLLAALAGVAPAAPRRIRQATETPVVTEGPWGRLEQTPVRLRVPEEMLPGEPLPIPPWSFGDTDPSAIAAALREAGVEAALARALLESARSGELTPSPEQIRTLPPDARGRLYEALRHRPGNSHQLYPVRLARDRLERRLVNVAPTARVLVESLLYERDSLPRSWLLADLPALTWLVADTAERGRVIQAVSQRDSLLLRLRVDAGSDVDALVRWWGRGGRRRDTESLLRSVQSVEGGYDLDAVHLLPPSVRALVYTYPAPDVAAERDCFWTAVRFLERTGPSPGLAEIQRELSRLVRVEGPLQLGDVLLFSSRGELVHAAVYLAADVYFTKNGGHFSVPWLFARREDLLDLYDDLDPGGAVHYRWPDVESRSLP